MSKFLFLFEITFNAIYFPILKICRCSLQKIYCIQFISCFFLICHLWFLVNLLLISYLMNKQQLFLASVKYIFLFYTTLFITYVLLSTLYLIFLFKVLQLFDLLFLNFWVSFILVLFGHFILWALQSLSRKILFY